MLSASNKQSTINMTKNLNFTYFHGKHGNRKYSEGHSSNSSLKTHGS